MTAPLVMDIIQVALLAAIVALLVINNMAMMANTWPDEMVSAQQQIADAFTLISETIEGDRERNPYDS